MNIVKRSEPADAHEKALKVIGALIFVVLLVACGASAAISGGGTPTVAPTINVPKGEFVLIWQLYGTPTSTPTLGSTALAMHQTAEVIRQTAVKSAPTAGAASGGAVASGPGDAARGQRLFGGAGTCFSCHDTKNGIVIVGPSLKGVATRAGSREAGKSADDYLRESILTPNAFVVPGFPAGVMPQNFSQLLSPGQINDLIAYLETLK